MFHLLVQDLSKFFKIYARPVDRLLEAITRKPRHQRFDVLQNISFSVEPGTAIGLVGDNGAGKSTLLKILSGTLTPTSGTVQVGGTISALLELGAGFHPEFTGRQNISLACNLHGIAHDDARKLEEKIIRFAELGPFIDRPVKTYSSGMYVRLGFSIATLVDPDILIVDEALAVGDLNFQQKCIQRMTRFRERGGTMIFCSHSMYHIEEVCEKTIWLHKGEIYKFDATRDVIAEYRHFCKTRVRPKPGGGHRDPMPRRISENQTKDCHIIACGLETRNGEPVEEIRNGMDVVARMEIAVNKDGVWPHFGVAFQLADGTFLFAALSHHDDVHSGPYRAGEKVTVRLNLQRLPLTTGVVRLLCGVSDSKGLLWYERKDQWPIKVKKTREGVGLISIDYQWDIAPPAGDRIDRRAASA